MEPFDLLSAKKSFLAGADSQLLIIAYGWKEGFCPFVARNEPRFFHLYPFFIPVIKAELKKEKKSEEIVENFIKRRVGRGMK